MTEDWQPSMYHIPVRLVSDKNLTKIVPNMSCFYLELHEIGSQALL